MKNLHRITRSAVAGALLLLCSICYGQDYLPYYDSEEFTPHWHQPNSPELEGFHQIPEFSFTNQDGKEITEHSLEGKIFVANFFFTTCPGICPTVRSKLSRVQEAYVDDAQVEIISHSITPTIDTVDTLKQYAKLHEIESGKWHLLTGDRNDIYELAKNSYFASDDLGRAEGIDDFLHTENLLLIDKNRRIRGIYNGLNNTSVNYLIADIAVLKQEN